METCCLIREGFRSVCVRLGGPASEFDYGVQRRTFALQRLVHQVARFVPGDARLELRVIHQLLCRSEDLGETSFGLRS